jgi:hypothetical protein
MLSHFYLNATLALIVDGLLAGKGQITIGFTGFYGLWGTSDF